MIILKSKADIERMRRAGGIVARAHEAVGNAIKPGVTTEYLDGIVFNVIQNEGAVSSFKGYHGYPANICVSINEEVVHGIPGNRVLQEGDIVSVDIGAMIDGFHGDSAWTYAVGRVDEQSLELMEAGERSLEAGVAQAMAGGRLSDISHAVQQVAEGRGFSVVRDFVGHGIGRDMHEQPQIPNFGPPGMGPRLKAGMTLAIEPMINAGSPAVKVLDDGWTAVTVDGLRAVHYEHTVAVTENGPEILTRLS